MKSILFVASEGLPFIKSGGLADVIGSLPQALVKRGHDVRIVMPLYLKIAQNNRQDFQRIRDYSVSINYHEVPVALYQQYIDGIHYYFIENQFYFERDGLYGYEDDGERYAYFQKAVLEMLNQLEYFPDILHCHDWHTGMIPAMVKENYRHDGRYAKMKHVYTIHNLAYQGNFGREMLESCLGLSNYLYDCGAVRYDTGISFMKSGIVYADRVTTVSPTYSREILTVEYGEHLEQVLQMRSADLGGITNGIDVNMWNPATDPKIYCNYNRVNVIKNKKANKVALQKELGLVEDENVFMLGMVTRLTNQKGLELVLEQMNNIVGCNMQLVILGSGDADMEQILRECENGNKGKVVFYCGYNDALSHKIYAACDGFLMPSKFEPCGISQLISLRYGTLPIVRETGGLKDTVTPYNEFTVEGNGFSFSNFDSWEMMQTIYYALHVYYDFPKDWKKLISHAMTADVSWDKSAQDYSNMYEYL